MSEDLKPLGFNFIRLGLQDVLLDPKTNTIYTPNTNQTTMFGKSSGFKEAIQSEETLEDGEEQRFDGQNRDDLGRFDKDDRHRSNKSKRKKAKSGENHSENVDNSSKSGTIKHESSTKSGKGKGTVKLSKKEYKKVVSEINTVYYRRYEGKEICYHSTLWKDKYYTYRFKNHGFDDYEFEERIKN